jgi:hypothetical protein
VIRVEGGGTQFNPYFAIFGREASSILALVGSRIVGVGGVTVSKDEWE